MNASEHNSIHPTSFRDALSLQRAIGLNFTLRSNKLSRHQLWGRTMLKLVSRDFCLARAHEHEKRAAACSDPAMRSVWLLTAAEWREVHSTDGGAWKRRGKRLAA